MAELQLREKRTLKALSQMTEPIRASDIAKITGDLAVNVGNSFKELAKSGLAEQIDKDQNTWQITDKGKETAATIQVSEVQLPEAGGKRQQQLQPVGTSGKPQETLTFPSQLDTFRSEGELLAVGSKKGEIPIDTIVKWVERMADLDDLDSIWNALTGLAIPDHIKKRWLQLYSQNLTKHKISDELKEKIEAGPEEEKRLRTEGEVLPKPKRFSIVAGEIMGDPEGDYYFNEAFKIWAQQKGVPADQVNPWSIALEAMLQTSKEGPQTLTTLLTALTPLMKPSDTSMSSVLQQQVQALQTQIVSLTEERHKAEMESLRAEIRGQKSPESVEQIQLLNKRLDDLREELHKKDIEMMGEQNRLAQEGLKQEIIRLEQRISLVDQGKTSDSKIGLLSDIVNKGFSEISGLRSDVKAIAPTILSRGASVKRRTEEEKAGFSEGLDKGIEQTKVTREMEEKLWPELSK